MKLKMLNKLTIFTSTNLGRNFLLKLLCKWQLFLFDNLFYLYTSGFIFI